MAKESQALCQLRELKAPKWNFTTLSPSTLLGEPPHKTKHPRSRWGKAGRNLSIKIFRHSGEQSSARMCPFASLNRLAASSIAACLVVG
eukprot:COSAG03_NODE_23860_length_276_cov_1.118644_1_plen_88_part_10